MKEFLSKHSDKINGHISCFDRIIFKGYLPLTWSDSMEYFLKKQGILNKDFKQFVMKQSEAVINQAKKYASKRDRPYIYLNSSRQRKEALVKDIIKKDNINDGLVCVLSAVEPCQSFGLRYGKNKPRLESMRRKCLCLYYYMIHRKYGLMYIRIQTWFPFSIQIYINGHEWLARKLDNSRIRYTKIENAFVEIEDCPRAQKFSDRMSGINWPTALDEFAYIVNPHMKKLLADYSYYWVVAQAEYATDIMFKSSPLLSGLYKGLIEHSISSFGAQDILTFLGRKLHGRFEGQILGEYKTRWPGVRVKHRMKENWIKMYNKHGSVLRVETVINHPYEFKIRRKGRKNGKEVMGWFPMLKGVSNIFRYVEVSKRANFCYLEALACVNDCSCAYKNLDNLGAAVKKNNRSYRGFNPALEQDVALFSAVLSGSHIIHGFRNRDIRESLFSNKISRLSHSRASSKVSRLLKRLHVRGLIAKIPRSRRWRVTKNGYKTMSSAIFMYKRHLPEFVGLSAA